MNSREAISATEIRQRIALRTTFLARPEYEILPMPLDWQGPYTGSVIANKLLEKADVTATIPVAHMLAAQGNCVILLPTSKVEGQASHDAFVNNLTDKWEFKRANGSSASIHNAVRRANKQGTHLLLVVDDRVKISDVLRFAKGQLMYLIKVEQAIQLQKIVLLMAGTWREVFVSTLLKMKKPDL